MTDRSHEPSGFLRAFAPLLGVLAGVGLVIARRARRKDLAAKAAAEQDDETPEGHPS